MNTAENDLKREIHTAVGAFERRFCDENGTPIVMMGLRERLAEIAHEYATARISVCQQSGCLSRQG